MGVKLFELNTVPLARATELAIGETYVDINGHLGVYQKGEEFELLQQSPLRTFEGYTLDDIKDNKDSLELFWTLLKNDA